MGNSNTQTTTTNVPNHSIKIPRPSLLYTSSIPQERIDMHIDLFKSGIKLLLFGSNRGKSSWFNESTQAEPLAGITFKAQSFIIDKKVSKIKAIIYDTAEQPKYLKDTLKYIPSISPNGIILTYDPHNIETINHLKHCLESIEAVIAPNVLMLLLGIQSRHNSTYNLLQIQEQNRDIAHAFATENNLFHLQIDISTNDFVQTEPYIYFLRKIVKFMEKKDDSLVNMIRDLIEPSDGDEDDEDDEEMYNEESEQKEHVQMGTPIDDLQKIWREQPGSVYSHSEHGDAVNDEYEQQMEKLLSPQQSTTTKGGGQRHRGRTESFANNLNKFSGNTTDHLDAIFEEMEHENDNAQSDSDEKVIENLSNPKDKLLPATFHRFKSHKSEQDSFDIDEELQKAEHQMLWERYIKKHGLPQKCEQFMSWTKKNGKTLTFKEAMNVIEHNGHTVFENIDHYKLEAARPYQLEFQDNTKAVINAESSHNHKNAHSVFDGDNACQLEFERFFVETMGKNRAMKYMDKFNEKCYNDIRLVDPEIFDEEWMKSDDIEMNIMDKKLFKREVQKYKDDCYKFEQRLDGIKMKEKYLKSFGNCGIMTLWSFYHHIHGMDDVLRVVKNQQHAQIIWKELKIEEDEDGKSETSTGMMDVNLMKIKSLSAVDIVLPESNESLSPTYLAQVEGNGEQKMSDSEEFYENESTEEEEMQKKVDTPSTTGSDLNLMDRKRMVVKNGGKRRKRRRKKKKNVYVENVKLKKKEESVSSPKLQKRKSRKRVRKKKKDQNEEMFADIMPLDEVQKLFVHKMGNRPTSVKQLLSFCQQNGIGWKFKHINKWWRNRPDV